MVNFPFFDTIKFPFLPQDCRDRGILSLRHQMECPTLMYRYLLALVLVVSSGLAQSPLGTVTGLATDPSGAAIPNASVRLTSVQTGVERQARNQRRGRLFVSQPAAGQL